VTGTQTNAFLAILAKKFAQTDLVDDLIARTGVFSKLDP